MRSRSSAAGWRRRTFARSRPSRQRCRAGKVTRQLLSFSRRQPLDPVVTHPAAAVDAIRDVLSGSTRVNIDLSIDIAKGTWPIRVDRSEFALALVNIAINARDSMPEGG